MLKIAFDFVSSLQFVDVVIFQINYAVDGSTNGCTKKAVEVPVFFFSNIMEKIPQLSEKHVLSYRDVFSSQIHEKY